MEITLIDNITHASEVFKTLNTILKDPPIIEGLWLQSVPLAKLVDTTYEQFIDLDASIKHVVLGD